MGWVSGRRQGPVGGKAGGGGLRSQCQSDHRRTESMKFHTVRDCRLVVLSGWPTLYGLLTGARTTPIVTLFPTSGFRYLFLSPRKCLPDRVRWVCMGGKPGQASGLGDLAIVGCGAMGGGALGGTVVGRRGPGRGPRGVAPGSSGATLPTHQPPAVTGPSRPGRSRRCASAEPWRGLPGVTGRGAGGWWRRAPVGGSRRVGAERAGGMRGNQRQTRPSRAGPDTPTRGAAVEWPARDQHRLADLRQLTPSSVGALPVSGLRQLAPRSQYAGVH